MANQTEIGPTGAGFADSARTAGAQPAKEQCFTDNLVALSGSLIQELHGINHRLNAVLDHLVGVPPAEVSVDPTSDKPHRPTLDQISVNLEEIRAQIVILSTTLGEIEKI